MNLFLIILLCAAIIIFIYSVIVLLMLSSGYLIKKTGESASHPSKTEVFFSKFGISYLLAYLLYTLDMVLWYTCEKAVTVPTIFFANVVFSAIIVSYDLCFVYLLAVGKWRPKFLKIPDYMTFEYIKADVWQKTRQGWPYVIVPIILMALLFYIDRVIDVF